MREKIKELKDKLNKRKEEIEDKLKGFGVMPDFGDETYDEETLESQEFANQMAMAQVLKNDLNEIGLALARIETGKFGICENCGKEIEDEILEIAPQSRLCRECKKDA